MYFVVIWMISGLDLDHMVYYPGVQNRFVPNTVIKSDNKRWGLEAFRSELARVWMVWGTMLPRPPGPPSP